MAHHLAVLASKTGVVVCLFQCSMDADELFKIRHSLSHILAWAVKRLYPNVKLGIGPAIDNGFYYDFLFDDPISESDLKLIYNEMLYLLQNDVEFVESKLPRHDAINFLYEQGQPFKAEIASELQESELTFYTCGDFIDLCKGPHVNNTSQIDKDAFRLTHIAGAYWRGDEHREMMQRIYGVAFKTKQELDQYLFLQEEAKRRDHRKIGKQLDLFVFSDLVGPGLPLFTPEGTFLRSQLLSFSEQLQQENGFERVFTPHLAKSDLYKVSGHWEKYKDDILTVYSKQADEQFVIKPMNCPHHIQIFNSKKRSYRELPIRYFESNTCYRDEKSGELLGLSRVRSLTQDDAHVFCREDQVVDELKNILKMVDRLYSALDLKFRARLSFRDNTKPEKYLGTEEEWNKAQNLLLSVVNDLGMDSYVAYGEAAFYGPKIDIMVTDALGREWQCATQQVDYFLPQRFGLVYTDRDGKDKPVVMIHKAILGSIERFLSVYVEHTAGNFPLWLCYNKAAVVPVTNKSEHLDYAYSVLSRLLESGIRSFVDDSGDTLNNKIRKAQLQKIPYILVVGDKEMDHNVVSVRLRNGSVLGLMSLEELIGRMNDEIVNKK